jgi:hypothetical protein
MGDDWKKIFEDLEREAKRDAIILGCLTGVFVILLLLVNGI